MRKLLDGALQRPAKAGGPWICAAIALAWSLHPLRVEAVTWVTQRREVLCGLLCLLAIASRLGRSWWISASLAIAAMLAKVTAVTLPFLFVLIDVWKSGGFAPGWPGRASRAAIRQTPLFVAAGVLVGVSFLAQREANAIVSTEFLSATGRVGLYFFGVAFCTLKTFAPLGLAPLHQGQVGCTWNFQPFVWWWAAAGLGAAATALVLGWRARADARRVPLRPRIPRVAGARRRARPVRSADRGRALHVPARLGVDGRLRAPPRDALPMVRPLAGRRGRAHGARARRARLGLGPPAVSRATRSLWLRDSTCIPTARSWSSCSGTTT